ncbi:unnamed protein product [Adineta ricciae]|uniref:Major facilitator superfamily (MFS) profile domain-containing protein n=1 Tax=Adineta ricciae TaxID=249248 RepID=A0A814SLE2_ADIRI|nr:unnamed protein product [Adineta ricciae]
MISIGISMLADRFSDDHARGTMLGHALSGVGVGLMVGPIFGGLTYFYFGQTVPFLILARLALFDGLLRLSIILVKSSLNSKTTTDEGPICGSSILIFFQDRSMLIILGAHMIALFGVAVIQTTLPIYMMTISVAATLIEQGKSNRISVDYFFLYKILFI